LAYLAIPQLTAMITETCLSSLLVKGSEIRRHDKRRSRKRFQCSHKGRSFIRTISIFIHSLGYGARYQY